MFKKGTIEKIRKHKWVTHSNQTQFFTRIRDEIHLGFKDMTVIADELPEEQLKEIFTEENLKPLIISILKPHNQRTIHITEMIAYQLWLKLLDELPDNMVNNLRGDIGKTWVYANLLKEHTNHS